MIQHGKMTRLLFLLGFAAIAATRAELPGNEEQRGPPARRPEPILVCQNDTPANSALPLMEALRKMTILPAQRIGLPDKGRIKIGADTRFAAFDPAHVIDRATYEKPQYSDGTPYVIVNGAVVVNKGRLRTGVFPGGAVRRAG